MIVKLLTEHHLEFLSLKDGCRGSSGFHLSKCQIVGNLMPPLKLSFHCSAGLICLSLLNFVDLCMKNPQ